MVIIKLDQLKLHAYHGVYSGEPLVGGEFEVNLEVEYEEAGLNFDKLEDTIDLQEVYNLVRKEMQLPSKLIEHAAYRIVKAIKQQFCQIENVKVTLRKLNPPISGQIEDEAIVISE